ncbi:unnamed protein product [Clonostachys rosea]|uniref:Heterokaryon incompatibility domain-containing protein n=1 Tax=Bionectria ochroleuca TaxID=29856 RepID=A0ABY6TW99_BIOOC|nr:unnamed protein product [Clonostachys rosea]
MLCKVCLEVLQSNWDTPNTRKVCRLDDHLDPALKELLGLGDPDSSRPDKFIFGHHVTFESFQKSVQDGCSLCSMFEGEQEAHPRVIELGYYSLLRVVYENNMPSVNLSVGDRYGGIDLCQHDDDGLNLDLGTSTGDEATWDKIQNWLHDCLDHHESCNQPTSYLPPRLLRLNKPTGTFHILNGNTITPGAQYITLSHSFTQTNFQLTQSTLASLSESQPLSALPLAYRDTFTIVDRLGLSYLWIDQLCVLQDDQSDQLLNANEAGRIFSRALLGICALGSKDPYYGLFTGRDPDVMKPTILKLHSDSHDATPYILETDKELIGAHAFHKEPASTDAKVFRQRLLSPRMVHFGQRRVYWECYGAICDELHPSGWSTPVGLTMGREGEMAVHNLLHCDNWKPLIGVQFPVKNNYVDQIFTRWFHLLREYSRCAVPSSHEKLQNIQFMAEDMKRLLQCQGCNDTTYLAGMWKLMLPKGLVWSVYGAGTRPAAAQFPSWSWASVNGIIDFHVRCPTDTHTGLFCELVGVGMSLSAEGLLNSAITLRGKITRTNIRTHPKHGVEETLRTAVSYSDLSVDFVGGDDCGTVLFDTKEDVAGEVFCFPISGTWGAANTYWFSGLALSRLSNGTYVRCGVWSFAGMKEEYALDFFHNLPPEQEITIV